MSTITREKWDFDVLVVGGGACGKSLLAGLLTSGEANHMKMGYIPSSSSSKWGGNDATVAHVSALNPGSLSYLRELGAWEHISSRSQAFQTFQAWDHAGPGIIRFSAPDMNLIELGRVVEDNVLEEGIDKVLSGHDASGAVEQLDGWCIQRIDSPTSTIGHTRVTLANTCNPALEKRIVTCRLVVCAGDDDSIVRREAGISTCVWGNGKEALICTVKMETQHETVWQRFLENGHVLIFPLWEGYSSVVWSSTLSETRRLEALAVSSPEDFILELNNALQIPPNYILGANGTGADPLVEGAQPPPPPELPLPSIDDLPLPMEVRDRLKDMRQQWLDSPLHARVNDTLPTEEMVAGAYHAAHTSARRVTREIHLAAEAVMSGALLGDPFRSPPHVTDLASPVTSMSLDLYHAHTYVAEEGGVVLMGAAAHSVLPQAGLGMNLALADARALYTQLVTTLRTGGNIGAHTALEPYATVQARRNLSVLAAVDSVNRVYSAQGSQALSFIRSLAMLALHSFGAVKGDAAKVAMGYDLDGFQCK